jgi:hypothetical protein
MPSHQLSFSRRGVSQGVTCPVFGWVKRWRQGLSDRHLKTAQYRPVKMMNPLQNDESSTE